MVIEYNAFSVCWLYSGCLNPSNVSFVFLCIQIPATLIIINSYYEYDM